ncbi:N-acetylmuramoyl-L-alanine amidase [Streptomyces wuyuanensis]|uniref:N-acetylmuramoyl-L-alanine amidase n=1 Tax=Streptomyces wuyuanensis TaxID=1196353 RepID=UPI0037A7C3F5
MKFVTRAAWGARAYRTPGGATLYSRARRGVKVHYLGSAYTDRPHAACAAYVRKLQDSHMDGNGWSDIGYSFVVCTHGYVFEGRGLRRRNSANGNTSLNEQDYAVCALLGSSGLTKPTDAQLHGIRDAIEHCRTEGPAGTWIGGHRDDYATACPGDVLYAWVEKGAPRPASSEPPVQEEDDMTPEQAKQLEKAASQINTVYNERRYYSWGYTNKNVDPRDVYGVLTDMDKRVKALESVSLTDAQVATIADKVAASPALAEKIAELVADKLAARLAE